MEKNGKNAQRIGQIIEQKCAKVGKMDKKLRKSMKKMNENWPRIDQKMGQN